MPETLGGAILGPKAHVFLIGADQQALALLAQVIFAVAVGNRGQAAFHSGDLGDGFGDEILMFRGQQGQGQTRHRRHFARPKSRCIDHPRGADIALVGAHDPGAIGLLLGAGDGGKAVNLGATLARAGGIGVGDARRINIAALGLEHDAADAVIIDQWVQALGLITADLVEIHPVAAGLGLLQTQLMLARLGLRKIEAAGLEHAAALAGFRL